MKTFRIRIEPYLMKSTLYYIKPLKKNPFFNYKNYVLADAQNYIYYVSITTIFDNDDNTNIKLTK